jgi:hypothetical protein
LTCGGKEIKNSQQILQLLEAVWKPRAIAVIHCLAHTNWPDKISQGNGLVDRPAIKAALLEEVQKDATSAKVCFALPVLPDQPEYSSQKKEQAHKTGAKENSESWFITTEGMILIPEKVTVQAW